MTATVARALMAVATRCLGESRREWALAMRAEFREALAEGRPLAFAAGCLVAAWREMPKHAEGRAVLASYALALGLLIPMAVLQVGLALGFSSILVGGSASAGVLLAGANAHAPFLLAVQFSSAPWLLALWLLLGVGHLRLAWVLLERDWARVTQVSAWIGAALATLLILIGVLVLDPTFVVLQAVAMAVELRALVTVARRHARLFPGAAPEMSAR